MKNIINRIKATRKEKGFSHEFMAHELGISQGAYSNLEKCETKLTVERLIKISELLEKPVGFFIEENGSNQFNQNNYENSTGYLQQIEKFQNENVERIISLYEDRIKDKDELITFLKSKS